MITIENPTPEKHLRTEWLLTNGLGGYAMGTVLGVNTRRYHGLLVAALDPPVNRVVALHSMIEQLVIPKDDGTEEVIDLSTQMFVGPPPEGEPMLHPEGWRRLRRFTQWEATSIEWTSETNATAGSRSLELEDRRHCVHLTYAFTAHTRASLRIRPLFALRDFHSLRTRVDESFESTMDDDWIEVRSGGVSVALSSNIGKWVPAAEGWRNLLYTEERERGLDCIEQLWSPGLWETALPQGTETSQRIRVSLFEPHVGFPEPIGRTLPTILRRVKAQVGSSNRALLSHAAEQFIVRRGTAGAGDRTIIAGFPWFSDWGRDAMIALPGLLLTRRRIDEARDVLLTFARHLRDGLIPNRFADDGGPAEYNTVDASLWFVYAVWQWRRAAKNAAADDVLSACRAIIRAYRQGIRVDEDGHRFSIGLTREGLVNAGDETTQLTWMDAKRDGVVFTPRHGLAVEVNALWHNALLCVADMTDDEVERESLREFAGQVAIAFQMHFWWGEKECLHDVLTLRAAAQRAPEYVADGSFRFPAAAPAPHQVTTSSLHSPEVPHPRPISQVETSESDSYEWTPDGRLRPNQILAVSLPHSPLTREQQLHVVECVRRRFLTPFGLRTLDRSDPGYCGRYEGSLFERDRAYHNGTVWPWLIGPYCEALLRVNDFSAKARREARQLIQPLLDEMNATDGPRCLGQIAEVYDGDEPQRPSGCTAQAWSVAEVMRIQWLAREDADGRE